MLKMKVVYLKFVIMRLFNRTLFIYTTAKLCYTAHWQSTTAANCNTTSNTFPYFFNLFNIFYAHKISTELF